MATLTIDLDDQATDALENLNTVLEETAIAAETAGKGTDQLTEAQNRQVTVIHKQTAGMSELANTSLGALGQIGVQGVKTFGDITIASHHASTEIKVALIEAASHAINWGIVTFGAVKGVQAVWGSHKKSVQESGEEYVSFSDRAVSGLKFVAEAGAVATTAHVIGWDNVGKAAGFAGSSALKAVTGLGPQVAVVSAGIEGYRLLLSQTGLKTVELADGTTRLESNLTRVDAAAGKLGADISRDFTDAANAFRELATVGDIFPDVWKNIDAVATKGAENLISNIDLTQKGYNEAVISARSFAVQLLGGNADAYRKEVTAMRELSDWHEKMNAQREKERDGFAMLGRANQELADRQEYRTERERVASIKTTAQVDNEIAALRKKAAETAQAGKFDADAKEEFYQRVDELELRRRAIEKETSKQRTDNHRKAKEEYTEQMQQADDLTKRYREVYDLELKRGQERAKMGRDLNQTGKSQDLQTGMDAAKDQHAAEKDITTSRLKAQGATETEIKKQIADMDREFAASVHAVKMQQIADEFIEKRKLYTKEKLELDESGINGIEYEKRLSKIKSDATKADFEARKKAAEETGRAEREQNAITAGQRLANMQALWKAEEERASKLKAQHAAAISKNFKADEFLNQQDPQAVLKQLQNSRAAKAQIDQSERDRDLFNKGKGGNKAFITQYARNQKKAMAQARRSVTRDAMNGNIGEGELQQAQTDVAKQGLITAQKQGKLSGDLAKVMAEQMQALADQASINDQLQTTVAQLVAQAKGLKQTTGKQAQQARDQQGSLN